MVQFVEYSRILINDLILSRQITATQLSYAMLMHTTDHSTFFNTLCSEGWISNQYIIDSFARISGFEIADLEQGYEVLDYSKIIEYCKVGYAFCYDRATDQTVIVVCEVDSLEYLQDRPEEIKLIYKSDFYCLIDKTFSAINTAHAKYNVDFLSKKACAKNVRYIRTLSIMTILYVLCLGVVTDVMHVLNHMIYFSQNALKALLFFSSASLEKQVAGSTRDSIKPATMYPVYTILVPLYHEASAVIPLITHLQQMMYPKSKLDIKLVVECDDSETLNAIRSVELPYNFHVIEVPCSFPRTKPKALNYAMQYARGEYVVIYDAEDRPDVDQLAKALTIFQQSPTQLACLQAKLNYYNRDENMLTKLFSIEYSLWFEFLLPGLSKNELPVPLGGTSNHFRIDALRQVGEWDPYDVTEDADLGLRLHSHGYRADVIDSYTMEEATVSVKAWVRQRARWVKGFIQVFCVYLQCTNLKNMISHPAECASVWIFVGFSSYTFLMTPWLLITGIFMSSIPLYWLVIINLIFSASYMLSVAFIIIQRRRQRVRCFSAQDWLAFVLWPLYFILHTIAAYMAVFELIVSPFQWNKTTHNISQCSSSAMTM